MSLTIIAIHYHKYKTKSLYNRARSEVHGMAGPDLDVISPQCFPHTQRILTCEAAIC